tara:strand:- start:2462 stop:2647 length:186 start_codon:yes stop_codon:yes gene_type:complete
MSEISELKVLRSAAGYYIGRTENGMPYSRESDYFHSKDNAEWALSYKNMELEQDPHWEDII